MRREATALWGLGPWLVTCLLAAPASAGGIHRRPLSLPRLCGSQGFAVVLEPEKRAGARVTGKVLSCHGKRRAGCAAGSRQTFALFEMPELRADEWIEIDRHWNACDRCAAPGRASVILVLSADGHYEPLEDTPRNRRLLRILGRPGWQEAYARTTPPVQLEKDLGDPDLFQLAHGGLARRGRLSFKLLFDAARRIEKPAREEGFNLLLLHLAGLSGKARARVLDRLVTAVKRGERHDRVFQALERSMITLAPADLDRVRRLVEALSITRRDERPLLTVMLYRAGRLIASGRAAKHTGALLAFCRAVLAQKDLSRHHVAIRCRTILEKPR